MPNLEHLASFAERINPGRPPAGEGVCVCRAGEASAEHAPVSSLSSPSAVAPSQNATFISVWLGMRLRSTRLAEPTVAHSPSTMHVLECTYSVRMPLSPSPARCGDTVRFCRYRHCRYRF
jgi:hypothetical protein